MDNVVVETEVRKSFQLRISDGREYAVTFTVSAVIAVEKALGISLKNAWDFMHLDRGHVAGVLHAGLAKYHPDVCLSIVATLCDEMGPEGLDMTRYALAKIAYPDAMRRYEEALEKAAKDAAENKRPNVQGEAAL